MHFGSCDLDLVLVHRKRNPRPTRNDGVWGTRQIVGAETWVTGGGLALVGSGSAEQPRRGRASPGRARPLQIGCYELRRVLRRRPRWKMRKPRAIRAAVEPRSFKR
jgi:hypothetical protein